MPILLFLADQTTVDRAPSRHAPPAREGGGVSRGVVRWHVAVAAGHKSGHPGFKRCHPRSVLDLGTFPLALRMWRVQRHPAGTNSPASWGMQQSHNASEARGEWPLFALSPGRNIPVSIFSFALDLDRWEAVPTKNVNFQKEKAPQVLATPRGHVRQVL